LTRLKLLANGQSL